MVIFDVYACFRQHRIVERAKSVEVFCIHFGGSIATHQMVFEKDAYFGYERFSVGILGGCYLNACHQVFFAVCAQHTDGELRAGEDDRFVQSFKHKAQCRGGICHCVRTVKDNKAVEPVVIITNDLYQFAPCLRFHV